MEIEEYLCRPRDTEREKELLRRLRELPEEERYAVVQKLLQRSQGIGLLMAARSLRQKRYFEEILELGLRVGDASSIRSWLECTVPRLGFHKVILILGNRMEADPVSVEKALYWMDKFKPRNNPKADTVWDNIRTRRPSNVDTERSEPTWVGSATAYRE